jgi:lipopolysaccharide/colanic/teichoic acid biosynthesis glycosyltransferase
MESNSETAHPKTSFRSPFIFERQREPGVWLGKNSSIHPSAQLTPPVLLGNNIRIGRGVILGPEVVVGSNVILSEDATVQRSTIFDNTFVGQMINIEHHLVDKNLVIDYSSSEFLRIDDLFLLRRIPPSLNHTIYGRIVALMAALLLLLAAAPLMLISGLLLKAITGKVLVRLPCIFRYSGRPHDPANKHLSTFYLYNFCTSQNGGPSTRLGDLLDRLELHRLPELWNLLKGDLRLVGVKPLTLDEGFQLREAWQLRHNDYFPGITGAWFVDTDRESSLDDILLADVLYLSTRTPRKDIQILIKTPEAWLRRIRSKSRESSFQESL